ncbi:hypothetical protein [Flavobacterium silvaticum]|uniref:Uncharacterized protein n=1 Tax=Flavobacterium silvaticum TaxID=1852020 RepID=A0A972JHH4_9FLAO|nr:hypothetical protein [Flavobacterium silvaticum]NMH27930.1 hypothetical protein [Flavobacterium silvaticum]
MKITHGNLVFDFTFSESDNKYICQTFIGKHEVEIIIDKELFDKHGKTKLAESFTRIISLNFDKIVEKTEIWTKNLYDEVISFESEDGFFEKLVLITLIDVENGSSFKFEAEIPFFSRTNKVMDFNHSYTVRFSSIYDTIFMNGITRE